MPAEENIMLLYDPHTEGENKGIYLCSCYSHGDKQLQICEYRVKRISFYLRSINCNIKVHWCFTKRVKHILSILSAIDVKLFKEEIWANLDLLLLNRRAGSLI